MKKFLMAICALAGATTVATAAVGINWTVGEWGENHTGDGSGTILGSAILDNSSALWQLIYAGANDAIDPIPVLSSNPGPTDAYGDDVVWAYRTLAETDEGTNVTAPEDGSSYDVWLVNQGGSTMYTDMLWTEASGPGYVYQRVFELDSPVDGTWYYESELKELNTNYSPSAPTTVTQSTAAEGGVGFVTDTGQVHVVPEPATMSLLGLGALVMAIRRRRS